MASPERRIQNIGIDGVVLIGVLASIGYMSSLIKIGESREAVDLPQNSPGATINTRSYEVRVIIENLKLALQWIASQSNPAFDAAIADISRIQNEITEEDKIFYIADLDSSSLDQKHADIMYKKDVNGGSIILVLSKEKFTDRVFDSAAAGEEVLKAWKKWELAKIKGYSPGFDYKLDQEASEFVDVELARR